MDFVLKSPMEYIADGLYYFTRFYLEFEIMSSRTDKRVIDWFLIPIWWHTWGLALLYLIVVNIGPMIMAKRKPIQLRWSLFFYNMFLVALNAHIFSEILICSYKLNYSYSCQLVHYGDDPTELRMAKALWWYYISKFIEFGDTILFILRKKNQQITFLHVYHHVTMFLAWWGGVRWSPGGQVFFSALVNSLIHVVMYTYYGLSALGPGVQKYLWWKRYLTIMQITQFLIGVFHFSQAMLLGCKYPMFVQVGCCVYGLTLLALFMNFYYQAYIKSGLKFRVKKSSENGHSIANGHSHSTESNHDIRKSL